MGTFNYVSTAPDNAPITEKTVKGAGHIILDVLPYYVLGGTVRGSECDPITGSCY